VLVRPAAAERAQLAPRPERAAPAGGDGAALPPAVALALDRAARRARGRSQVARDDPWLRGLEDWRSLAAFCAWSLVCWAANGLGKTFVAAAAAAKYRRVRSRCKEDLEALEARRSPPRRRKKSDPASAECGRAGLGPRRQPPSSFSITA
jgi:hypothetical protein